MSPSFLPFTVKTSERIILSASSPLPFPLEPTTPIRLSSAPLTKMLCAPKTLLGQRLCWYLLSRKMNSLTGIFLICQLLRPPGEKGWSCEFGRNPWAWAAATSSLSEDLGCLRARYPAVPLSFATQSGPHNSSIDITLTLMRNVQSQAPPQAYSARS